MRSMNFNLRSGFVMAAAAFSGLSPITALAWQCTNASGQTYSSSSPSYCAGYYPSCSSNGGESGACISPNFQRVTGSGAAAAASSPTASTPASRPRPSPVATSSTTSTTSTRPAGSVAAPVVRPTTPAARVVAREPAPRVVEHTDGGFINIDGVDVPAAPVVGVSSPTGIEQAASLVDPIAKKRQEQIELEMKAIAENKIAIGEAEKLQTQMAENQANHNEAVQYYRGPGKKDPALAARFFSNNKLYAADSDSGLSGDFGASSGSNKSGLSGADKTLAAKTADEKGMSRGGKSANGKGSPGAEDAVVTALKKATLAEKVAKLVKDASLRDQVKALLEESGDAADPELRALAEALAEAEGVAAGARGRGLASLSADELAKAKLQLNDEESQLEVGRLIASFGGDSNAASAEVYSEPLFSRVHSAHLRSLERGNVQLKRKSKN